MTSPEIEDRCTGHCCENFTVIHSPGSLKDAYLTWLDLSQSLPEERKYKDVPRDNRYFLDHEMFLIYPMLVYKSSSMVHPDRPHIEQPQPQYHYSCKHFDPVARVCTIYDIRPNICRLYGDSSDGCGYKECTSKKYRQLREECDNKRKQ